MTDIESPLYRVNRFVAALQVTAPSTKVISHLAGAFVLTVDDLVAVVRECYEARELIDHLRVDNNDYEKANAELNNAVATRTPTR